MAKRNFNLGKSCVKKLFQEDLVARCFASNLPIRALLHLFAGRYLTPSQDDLYKLRKGLLDEHVPVHKWNVLPEMEYVRHSVPILRKNMPAEYFTVRAFPLEGKSPDSAAREAFKAAERGVEGGILQVDFADAIRDAVGIDFKAGRLNIPEWQRMCELHDEPSFVMIVFTDAYHPIANEGRMSIRV